MRLETFWFALTVACLVWYSTITVYVAVRAVWDIRNMLGRLQATQDEQSPGDTGDPEP